MSDWLAEMGPVHWFILSFALLILEALMPGAFFLAIGLAAALVGLIVLMAGDMSWQGQCILFGCLAMALVIAGFLYRRKHPPSHNDSTLNRRGASHIGRVLVLNSDIINGRGKVRVNDTTWTVQCTDTLSAGQSVIVTAINGVVLEVEPAQD